MTQQAKSVLEHKYILLNRIFCSVKHQNFVSKMYVFINLKRIIPHIWIVSHAGAGGEDVDEEGAVGKHTGALAYLACDKKGARCFIQTGK